MTKQHKDLLTGAGKIIGIAGPIAAIVVWALNTAFVTDTEFEPVKSAVDSLSVDIRAVREGLRLSNCLALSEKQGTPWQSCLR